MRNHDDDCGCNSCCERGPRGCDGPTGPAGTEGAPGRRGATGPTGFTGPSGDLDHVEDQFPTQIVLPPNTDTTVLTTPAITAPIGAILEITAAVSYRVQTTTAQYGLVDVALAQDGTPLLSEVVSLSPVQDGGPPWEMFETIPIVWYVPGDGLSHVYSVIMRQGSMDGTHTARHGAIIAKVLPA